MQAVSFPVVKELDASLERTVFLGCTMIALKFSVSSVVKKNFYIQQRVQKL
jgi:hypothetical protein